jgi:IPTL-CTERM motif
LKLGNASGRVAARRRVFAWLLLTATFIVATARPAHADLIVPANSVMSLDSGIVDLACTDVIVAGTLQVASGSIVNARHVTIQAGGTINGGSGIVELGGNWTAAGQFTAGTSQVRFRDLCALTTATIAGNTTFATASFVTGTGKNYIFATGTTQTVTTRLEIAGTTALPIQFRSSTPAQVAFINLLAGGVQAIQHVGVTDVWATGQWLAPTLNNEGGGGNASRWFGGLVPVITEPIPTLADATLIALSALLAATGALLLRRRQVAPQNQKRPRTSKAP